MDLLKSFILGIVEGMTEFLPVSSTGHLIIFQDLINFGGYSEGFVEMYTYVIQLGAILAVLVLYREKILQTIVNLFPNATRSFQKSGLRFWLVIALACVPGAIAEFLVGDLVETYLFNAFSVSIVLVLGGVFMILAENRVKPRHHRKESLELDTISPIQAIIIGTFQCLAVIPGMSRSASTIIGGWFAGLSNVLAAEFSFFLAIPVMVGMSGLKIIKHGGAMTGGEAASLAVGFVVSFLVALVVIRAFIGYLKKHSMIPFAAYRIVFGLVIFSLAAFRVVSF